MNENNLNVEELIYAIKKRLKLIVIVTLGFTLVGFFIANYRMQTRYRATAKIFAGKSEEAEAVYSANELSDYKDLLDAYVDIVRNEDFLNATLSSYGIGKSGAAVMGGLSFTQLSSAPILQISYVSTNQAEAMAIVNAISNEFGTGVQSLILNSHIRVVEDTKCITILPNKTRAIAVSFAVGLIVALGIVFILDYLDKTIYRKKELEEILDIPIIGEIPTHSM